MDAAEVIASLGLARHPEGGWYRQTWAAGPSPGGRPHATAIHFLLARGEVSQWHRIDAAELWLWHAGAPLVLSTSPDADGPARDAVLGPDLAEMKLQLHVPPHHWQAARPTGDWTLVSCLVTPGFTFDGFELAPPGFDIARN